MKKKSNTIKKIIDNVQVHMVTDGDDTTGWVHTHGMTNFGLPELEIRGVSPLMMMPWAAFTLNELAEYMLTSKKKVLVNHVLEIGPTIFKVEKMNPIVGSEEHYEVERWTLTDVMQDMCCQCGMENHHDLH